MNLLYKAYCVTSTLINKSYYYMVDKRPEYETLRMNSDRSSFVQNIYNITYPMTQITPRIYLGNAYNARDYYTLKENNVGLIINCTPEFPNHFPEEFSYIQIPVDDAPNESLSGYFYNVSRSINEFLNTYPDKSVFIHCFMGASRSVSFLIAYMITYMNKSVDESIEYIESLRPIINLNVDFYFQLVEYHMTFHSSKNPHESFELTRSSDDLN